MRGLLIRLAALAAAVPATASAVPVVLDFDSAPQDWIKLETPFFSIDSPLHAEGFVVTTVGSATDNLGVGDQTWCFPACADNGTQALRSANAGTLTLIQREDLGAFDFLGFDIAGLITGFPDLSANGVRVIGYRADLSSVTQDFMLTGAAGFESFTANGLLTGLVKLTLEGFGATGFDYSADNIRLAVGEAVPVPAPASFALFAAGFGAIAWTRRRRWRR